MGELVSLIAKFGIPVVLVAALVFIVLHGRIKFEYPRDPVDLKSLPAPKNEISDGD